MATKKAKIIRPTKDFFCVGCGHEVLVEDGHYLGDENGRYEYYGYLPYCKTCCDTIAEDYLKKTKSIEASIYFTCAMNNVPFMRSVYEATMNWIEANEVKNPKPFRYYMNQLNLARKKKGFNAKSFYDSDIELGQVKQLKKAEQALISEIQELELDWGKQAELDHYSFLELKFETYSDGRELTPAMEQTIRYLCQAELEVRLLKEQGLESKEAEKKVANYYKILKLDNFTNDSIKSDEEKFIEGRAAIIERKEPAEYYEDKKLYADHQGFEKYAKNHLIRPMKNMLLGQKEYRIIKDEE